MIYDTSRHRYIYRHMYDIMRMPRTTCNARTAGAADSAPEPRDRRAGRRRSRMAARAQGGGRLAGTPGACASCPRHCPPPLRLRLTRPRVSSAVHMHTACAGSLLRQGNDSELKELPVISHAAHARGAHTLVYIQHVCMPCRGAAGRVCAGAQDAHTRPGV